MSSQRPLRLVAVLAGLVLLLGLVPTGSARATGDPVEPPQTSLASQAPDAYQPPQPPQAPQSVKAVSISRSGIALTWGAVTGAARYQVSYSTSSKMTSAKRVTVTSPAVDLKSLKAKKAYYITVRAISSAGLVGPVSSRLKVTTKSSSKSYTYLAPAGLVATTVSTDRLTVSWNSRGKGLRYRVAISTSSSFSNAEYHYVTGTSKTITKLLDGTTYYVRARVVSSSNKTRSVESPAIAVRTVAIPVTGVGDITVASYNVATKSITTGGTWEKRRGAVVETILSQSPDVIGLQEASQGKLSGLDLSQAEDLVNRLGAPYALANTARYNCKNPKSPHKCSSKYQGASNSQKIAYRTDKLTLVQHGSKRISSSKTKMTEHRYVEWAVFRDKASGRKFFFVNVHLDPGKTSKARSMRKKQVSQILDVIKAKNPTKLPTYVVGDFNSHKWSEPSNGVYDQMVKAGYRDPLGNTYKSTKTAPGAFVERRKNTHFSSFNYFDRVAPAKPEWINGIYLDYIWTSSGIAVPEWETVVKVDSQGRFIGQIPSDHNMLRARTRLG